MKPKIALSTCCLSPHHTEGDEMLVQAAKLGFEYVELSHGIRMSLVPGIMKAVKDGVIKVASCHNFCPLPPAVNQAAPNLYQPTSPDPRERQLWYKYTQRTIDFAAELEAQYVVLHGGSLKIFWEGALKKLVRYRATHHPNELATDLHYRNLVEKAMSRVNKKASEGTARLIESLRAIEPYAKDKGIRLGLENRDGLKELPLDNDWPKVLSTFEENEVIGYWHDSGHAAIKEQFGLLNHRAQVERLSPRCFGFHLKDALSDGTENLALGTGEIDFDKMAKHFQPHQVLTIEVGPNLTPEEIVHSREYLEARVTG